ncbi:MAG: sigma-70 family RNA polymerase sigma factor [Myxococcaceae bacterium]|nr:sigma-70 family RNA polymerase sigma factor [Myxococcaceae bacterium]
MRAHRHTLIHQAMEEGLDVEDALDAIQDAAATFITRSMWLGLESRPEEAVALLHTLTRNHARNARRRRHRRDAPLEAAHEPEDVSLEALEAELEHARQHVVLTGCLSTLRGAQRAVVVARLFEGERGAEVARSLGLTPGNLAVVLHRAKRRLKLCVSRSVARHG